MPRMFDSGYEYQTCLFLVCTANKSIEIMKISRLCGYALRRNVNFLDIFRWGKGVANWLVVKELDRGQNSCAGNFLHSNISYFTICI